MTESKETLQAIIILWENEGWTHAMLSRAFETSEKKIIKLITKAKMQGITP